MLNVSERVEKNLKKATLIFTDHFQRALAFSALGWGGGGNPPPKLILTLFNGYYPPKVILKCPKEGVFFGGGFQR